MELPFITNDTVDTLPLLSRRPIISLPYITVLGVAAILGTAGNLLNVGTLATDYRNKSVGNILIINLALSELVVTALINPFAIVGITDGKQFFTDKTWLCETLVNLCIASCVSSLLNIGLISINRYVFICHNTIYHHLFTRRCCVLMCLSTWIAGILLDLPTYVGWSRHEYDAKTHKCLWSRTFAYSYTVFFVTCGILVPLTVITAFYFKIFLFIGKAKQRLSHHKNDPIGKTLASTMRQAKMMCIIFVAFTTCWTPYVLVFLFDKYDTYPLEVHLFSSMTADIHASLNFIIYGCASTRIRKGYIWFIREKLCCCSTGTSQAALLSEKQKNDQQLSVGNDASNDAICNGYQKRKSSNRIHRCYVLPKKGSFSLNDAKFNSVSHSQGLEYKEHLNDNVMPEAIELQEHIVQSATHELSSSPS